MKYKFCTIFLFLQEGEIHLEVVFVAPDVDSDDENHEYEYENGFRCDIILLYQFLFHKQKFVFQDQKN